MGLSTLYQRLVEPASSSSSENGQASEVYLNVYDLTTYNMYAYWFGLGIFHSGVEVHGVEYAFGAHEFPTSGVFEVEPRKCPGFMFRTSILLGTTDMTPSELRQFMSVLAERYNGDSYHLLLKNCNHFTDDISRRLTNRPIPGWVNRLANIGWLCRCLLPDCIQLTASQNISELEDTQVNAEDKEIVQTKGDRERLLTEEAIRLMLQEHLVSS